MARAVSGIVPGDHPDPDSGALAGCNRFGDMVPEGIADTDEPVPGKAGLALVAV